MSSVADETTSGKEPTTTGEAAAGKARRPRRRISARQVAHGAKVGSDAIRSRIASVVWIIAVVCAVILALGAVLAALHNYVNPGNPVVETIRGVGNVIAGPFGDIDDAGKFRGGVFDLSTTAKDALANWGVATVAYLVVGRVLDRVIRP
jgi:hypothetical protein